MCDTARQPAVTHTAVHSHHCPAAGLSNYSFTAYCVMWKYSVFTYCSLVVADIGLVCVHSAASGHNLARRRIVKILFLIPCRYSSGCCCCCFLLVVGVPSSKKPKAIIHRLKSDRDQIWQSSIKYASIDRVGCLIWRHTFKMSAMRSSHAEKCCHLVSTHAASVIYSTFVLVLIIFLRH